MHGTMRGSADITTHGRTSVKPRIDYAKAAPGIYDMEAVLSGLAGRS